jgi:hypothetical protein
MVVVRDGVWIGAAVTAGIHVDVDVVQVPDLVQEVVACVLGDVVALTDAQVLIDHPGECRGETMADPPGLHAADSLHTVDV